MVVSHAVVAAIPGNRRTGRHPALEQNPAANDAAISATKTGKEEVTTVSLDLHPDQAEFAIPVVPGQRRPVRLTGGFGHTDLAAGDNPRRVHATEVDLGVGRTLPDVPPGQAELLAGPGESEINVDAAAQIDLV